MNSQKSHPKPSGKVEEVKKRSSKDNKKPSSESPERKKLTTKKQQLPSKKERETPRGGPPPKPEEKAGKIRDQSIPDSRIKSGRSQDKMSKIEKKKQESDSESDSMQNVEDEEMKEEIIPIKKSLYSRVQKSENLEKRLSGVKIPEDIDDKECAETQVCQICFQATKCPSDDPNISEEDDVMSSKDIEPSDIQMLYQLVYCKTCYIGAHWNCLGTDKQLIEYEKKGKTIYFFECDKCQFKQPSIQNSGKYKFTASSVATPHEKHGGMTCIACDSNEGLLKSFEINETQDSLDVDMKHIAFYHPICAMSFPNIFEAVVTSDSISFKLKDESNNKLLQQRKERGTKRTTKFLESCALCKSSFGLMMHPQTQNKDEPLVAHAYCILKQQYASEFDAEDDYTWLYQIILDKDKEYQPSIRVETSPHKLKSCICSFTEGTWVQCGDCQIWYHQKCVDFYNEKKDEHYQCKKCSSWKDHLQNNLLDIIYRRKTYHQLLNSDQTYWQNFDSICNYVDDSDMAIQIPVRIFEQVLMVKAWYVLADFMMKEVSKEELIEYHILEAKYLFPFIDTQPIEQELKHRKALIDHLIAEASEEMTIKDPEKCLIQAASQSTRDLKKEAIEHNKRAALKAQEVEMECLEKAKLINESVTNIRNLKIQCELLTKAVELLDMKQKPKLEVVKKLCTQIDEQSMCGYQSIVKLKEMLSEYESWVNSTMEPFKRTTPEEEKVIERLQQIKLKKVGLKRQEARYKLFQEYLKTKSTIDQVKAINEKSHSLQINVSEENLHLDRLIGVIETLQAEYKKFEQSALAGKATLGTAERMIIQACCFPFKQPLIDKILENWNRSAIWQIKAKQFLQDKLKEEQHEELGTRMDVDQSTKQRSPTRRRESSFNQNLQDFIWTVERAKALLQEFKDAQERKQALYVDSNIVKSVKDKVTIISNLRNAVQRSLQEDHDIKVLKDAQKEMESYETVDFTHEIAKIREKIKLIIDVKNVIQNLSKIKQSVEMLESIYNRVNEFADPKHNECMILIECDMKLMLEAKVTAGKNLKKEFHEILETKYQNTFTKSMVSELKSIVTRADQDFFIDMEREQRIIDNIPYSEEWFMQTYDRLKKSTGKALHQVDFKDFVQLSGVLTDEKECIQLLKGMTKSQDHLVGAAFNLWRSISGVKWLFEAKRLLKVQGLIVASSEEIELKKVIELDIRARELLGLNYDVEIQRNTAYSGLFTDFKRIVDCIRLFDERFGNYQKLLRTLEANQNKLDEFKVECENLTQILQSHKITSQSGELDLLSKIHTYIDFLHQYQQLTTDTPQNTKLEYKKAMILQQLARDKSIPEDLSILKKLRESVTRFEKFQREYSDYKRYREKVLKSTSVSLVETRFTCQFVKKLIEEQSNLQIEDKDDQYFDRTMLEGDLNLHEKWRNEADLVIGQLEDDEVAITQQNDEIREKFEGLKKEMGQLPLYDKEMFIKMQVFDWLYSASDMLNPENKQSSEQAGITHSLGSWDGKIKQADTFLEQLSQHYQQTPGQVSPLIKNLKNHSIYQSLIWEVEQARTVMDFVLAQKTNQKSLAAKYNQPDQQKQQHFNMTNFFRNKYSRVKVEKMLDQARRSKIDLSDDIHSLEAWIKEYDTYKSQYDDETLFTQNSFERLRDIGKAMFLSPIDLSDIYLQLKPRLETAEALKLDLKRILQEHEQSKESNNKPVKRLKYSRVSHSLSIYHKECKIPGIKEIEYFVGKVQKSKQCLADIQTILDEINSESPQGVKEKIERIKKLFSDVEIDMEKKELEVKRQLFEAELRYVLFTPQEGKRPRRIELDEFKLTYERDFELLRDYLQDETMHARFLELKNQINNFAHRINRAQSKEELQLLEQEINKESALIDFTQCIADKDAQILLGKRSATTSRKSSDSATDAKKPSEDEVVKRRKLNTAGASTKVATKSESSGSSSSGSSSSGSSDGSSSDESSSSGSEEIIKKTENIASNRARRTIVPNMSSDYIYDNPSVEAQHKLAKQSKVVTGASPLQEELKEEVSSEDEQENLEQVRKDKKKKQIRKKKRELAEQLEEHRKAQRSHMIKGHSQQLKSVQNQDSKLFGRKFFREGDQDEQGGLSLVTQIQQDTNLMSSLQQMKNKIRDQSRAKILECLNMKETVFATLDPEELKGLAQEFEAEIFQKHPEVDSFYRQRITSVCDNIRYLKGFKDVSDLIAVKKALSFGKLLQNHNAFKEDIQKLDIKIKDRRQQLKELTKGNLSKQKQAKQEELASEEQKSADHADKVVTIVKVQSAEDLSSQMVVDDESDGVESYDSNPALFSDEEDEIRKNPMTPLQNILQQSKIAQQQQQKQAQQSSRNQYDPSQITSQQSHYSAFDTSKPQTPQQYPTYGNIGQQVRVKYNPFEVFEQRHLGMGSGYFKKASEPVLYDPMKQQVTNTAIKMNVAPIGSLMKVWEGDLEIVKENIVQCQIFSNINIQTFQALPEIPKILQLKGKSKIEDVMQHFLRLRKDQKLIKGWVVRKNIKNQENNDLYIRLFDELEQTQRTALFNVFPGVTLYMVPIIQQTKEFCKQMGLDHEILSNIFKKETQHNLRTDEERKVDQIKQLEEESHTYAFFSQIKQDFHQKQSSLNPEVLIYAIESAQQQIVKAQGEERFSSYDYNKIQNSLRPTGFPNMKSENDFQANSFGSDPRLISSGNQNIQAIQDQQFNSAYGEDVDNDDIDIDELIQGFKNQEYNIHSIQTKLMTIIHKVKGEKEAKLTQFLQELILSFNNPQPQIVKSEESEATSLGYSYPAGMGTSVYNFQKRQ